MRTALLAVGALLAALAVSALHVAAIPYPDGQAGGAGSATLVFSERDIKVYRIEYERGERVLPAVWGAAVAIGEAVYTPWGRVDLPCAPDLLAASGDGRAVYAFCGVYSTLFTAFRAEGGQWRSSLSYVPETPEWWRLAVYNGTLYTGTSAGVYLVAFAPTGFNHAFKGLGAGVAAGPRGVPVEAYGVPSGAWRAPDGSVVAFKLPDAGEGYVVYVALPSGLGVREVRVDAARLVPLNGGLYLYSEEGRLHLADATGRDAVIRDGVVYFDAAGSTVLVKALGEPWTLLKIDGGRVASETPLEAPSYLATVAACALDGAVILSDRLGVYIYIHEDSDPVFTLKADARVYCTLDGRSAVLLAGDAIYLVVTGDEEVLEAPLALGGSSRLVLGEEGVRELGSLPTYTFQYVDEGLVYVHPDPGQDEVVVIAEDGRVARAVRVDGQVYRVDLPGRGVLWLAVEGREPPYPYYLLGRMLFYHLDVTAFLVRVYIEPVHVRIAGVEPGWVDAVVFIASGPPIYDVRVMFACQRGAWHEGVIPAGVAVAVYPVAVEGRGDACTSARAIIPGSGEVAVRRIVARAALSLGAGGELLSSGSLVAADYYAQYTAGGAGLVASGSGPVLLEPSLHEASDVVAVNVFLKAVSGSLEFQVPLDSLRISLKGVPATETPPPRIEPGRVLPDWLPVLLASAGGAGAACAVSSLYYSRSRR